MVYLGPSRGCYSCKRRRKKCDQTRPACMRCTKAHRVCAGYEDGEISAFRQYIPLLNDQAPPMITAARKCSLPVRVPIPGTDHFPEDKKPSEVTEEQRSEFALRAFFYDYNVLSTSRSLSREYLPGLEAMTRRLGPKSDLVKACQAVGFASHGKILNRPNLVAKAEMYYQELLETLGRAVKGLASENLGESRWVAMLLGLYQIAMATEIDPGSHCTHAKGAFALMRHAPSGSRAFDKHRLKEDRYSNVAADGSASHHICDVVPELHDTFPYVSVVFSAPALEGLPTLLLELQRLWIQHEYLSATDKANAVNTRGFSLLRRFADWQESRLAEFKPTIVTHIPRAGPELDHPVGYWPGRVETYFDLYVSGAWNVFRIARLLLIHLCIESSGDADDKSLQIEYAQEADLIVEDVFASIPYHLTDNLPEFTSEMVSDSKEMDPGRTLGGLLLLHPLYAVSRLPFISEERKSHARMCLAWIEMKMGLGQAGVLVKKVDIDRTYLISGFAIIWSGFLT
ncbi:putative C6 transcription factor [Xylariaceae sp. FL0016]|nr:putative C6 transcription factor [Xylariaceae sp. FL0016]